MSIFTLRVKCFNLKHERHNSKHIAYFGRSVVPLIPINKAFTWLFMLKQNKNILKITDAFIQCICREGKSCFKYSVKLLLLIKLLYLVFQVSLDSHNTNQRMVALLDK